MLVITISEDQRGSLTDFQRKLRGNHPVAPAGRMSRSASRFSERIIMSARPICLKNRDRSLRALTLKAAENHLFRRNPPLCYPIWKRLDGRATSHEAYYLHRRPA